jgi:hypothetical protein
MNKETAEALRQALAALKTADGVYMPTPKAIQIRNAIAAVTAALKGVK